MVWREKSEERDSLLHKNQVWAHPAASEGHLDMERALQCWDKRALHQLLVPSSSHPWLWHFSWQCFRPLLPKMTGIGFLILQSKGAQKCLKMFRWRFKVAQIIFLRGYLLYMLTWQSCLFACCARNYVKKIWFIHTYVQVPPSSGFHGKQVPQSTFPWRIMSDPPLLSPPFL